jgi:cytochrome b561
MPFRNDAARHDADRWTAASITLHWLTFAIIVVAASLGLWMTGLPLGLAKLQMYALHKSLGLTVLALTALRLLWRLVGRVPGALPGAPRWQHLLAGATHGALYFLLFAVPLSGWRYNSVSGFPLQWFGLLRLPALGATDLAAKHAAKEWHELLFYTLAALVAVHAVAALGHHYVWRDDTLRRMWFRRAPRATPLSASPPAQDTPP